MAFQAMELDPRSIVIASVLNASLLGAVSIGFARLAGSDRIIGAWGRAALVLAVGLSAISLQGVAPDWISVLAANVAIVAALVMAMRALRVFIGSVPREVLGWSLIALLALCLVAFTELQPSRVGRDVSVSAAVVIVAARAAYLLRRRAPAHCRRSCRFTEWIFWGVVAATLGRVAGIVLTPAGETGVLEVDPLNALTFLLYGAFTTAATLGIMWMEIESLQAELVRSARYDSLTGLYNRGTFLEEFEREVSRCVRGAPAFSLAMFDLDRFKRMNDEFGHPFGDRVLKAFAEVLRAGIRKHDTVGRYGGEEFALLMPNTGKDTAMRVAERLRRDLEARGITVDGKRIDVTVSGGVSAFGEEGEDWDALLSAADRALYEAKNAGRNRIVSAGKPGTT